MIAEIIRFIAAANNIGRLALSGVLLIATVNVVLAQELQPSILILPNPQVEVGEEVFFSASSTTYAANPSLIQKARYEWDFGDGYSFNTKAGFPYYYIKGQSVAVSHYFMRPGDFTVTLTVSIYDHFDANNIALDPPAVIGVVTTIVHVTGEAPMAGFEIQHAPFQSRLAQYLYVTIPESYRRNKTTLRVLLVGTKGSSSILFEKNNLADEVRILLDHKPLAPDDYVLIAELLNEQGKRIRGGLWRDKFSKQYPTIPKVGFDENNSIRINGELFFPVGPYMTDGPKIPLFLKQADINMLHTEGYYTTHNPTTWNTYLAAAEANGLLSIGPGRGNYSVDTSPNRWIFNHNPDRMTEYVRLNKDNLTMLAWSWQDEPNMGGWDTKVYAPTLAAWGYVCHREDPQHPAFNLFYGYDWSKYYGTAPNIYDYLASAPFLGGKKWVQDAIPFDIYPIQARLHPSMNFIDMGPYAAYLDALDRIQSNNKYLVPVLPAVQPCQENAGDNLRPRTDENVYLEAWMNVIHGAKGIIWFPYFDQPSMRWKAMKKFADQMKSLASVVLGPTPARTVTDDANTALRRVDTLIREKDGNIYIFAARVTEPDPIPGAKYQGVEPDSIVVNFTASLIGSTVAEVVDETRTILVTNGQFTDSFVKNAVHIYKIVMPTLRRPLQPTLSFSP